MTTDIVTGASYLLRGFRLIRQPGVLLFGAWMLCLQYTDYAMGNHRLSFSEQRRRLKQHRSLSLGFGGAALLATLIPGVNLIVMPVAVAGATAMYLERLGRPA